MDKKNRVTIALSIIVLMVAAMFASFGRNLFLSNIPSVELADPNSSTESTPGENHYWLIDVTPDTVQSIVETIIRPTSYYREIKVEYLWSGGGSTASLQVWHDQGRTHTRMDVGNGEILHRLTDGATFYRWYEGSLEPLAATADLYPEDLAQTIPTYEDVLEAAPEQFLETAYQTKDGLPCVYVAVQSSENTVERFWVSAEFGLLMAAQREQDGQVVYRMSTVGTVAVPCPATASFALPNGEILDGNTPE